MGEKVSVNLQEVLKDYPMEMKIIDALAQAALFDPATEVRDTAVQGLVTRWSDYGISVIRGYVDDGDIFLDIQLLDNKARKCFIDKAPKIYLGKPAIPIEFDTHPKSSAQDHQTYSLYAAENRRRSRD